MDEDSGMNFAEFVAILSGNNDLLNKTKLDNKIMQLEKEQAIFKKERIRAERKIAACQEEVERQSVLRPISRGIWNTSTRIMGQRQPCF